MSVGKFKSQKKIHFKLDTWITEKISEKLNWKNFKHTFQLNGADKNDDDNDDLQIYESMLSHIGTDTQILNFGTYYDLIRLLPIINHKKIHIYE